MLTHCRSNALALGFRRDDVAAVADMRTEVWLVRFEDVRSQQLAIWRTGDIRCGRDLHPGFVYFGLGALGGEGVGIARGKRGMQQRPDDWPVGFLIAANGCHGMRGIWGDLTPR
jgi:hypothetical protein